MYLGNLVLFSDAPICRDVRIQTILQTGRSPGGWHDPTLQWLTHKFPMDKGATTYVNGQKFVWEWKWLATIPDIIRKYLFETLQLRGSNSSACRYILRLPGESRWLCLDNYITMTENIRPHLNISSFYTKI